MLEVAPGAFALPERALWLPEERALVAGDLHLGYESSYQRGGGAVPAAQLRPLVAAFESLCDRLGPDVVVLNGDVKHSFRKPRAEEGQQVGALCRAILSRADVVVVEGNHDALIGPMLPNGARLVPSLTLGRVHFSHGHRGDDAPSGTALRVVSHEHPALVIRDEVGAALKFPAFLADPVAGVVVLPAMSPWARGVDVLTLPTFQGPALSRVAVGNCAATAVTEAGILPFGKVGDLRAALRSR